eukprot:TRINITY_DN66_c0_g2_i1.p1 TRINITY_DN66_c0_g2~~TRINITY_DN66_c0_g2_i1.p1  ORF type:complete len:346 (-),score=62.34 TRINITY_DN66_c0_g2_i1:133-1170(-)
MNLRVLWRAKNTIQKKRQNPDFQFPSLTKVKLFPKLSIRPLTSANSSTVPNNPTTTSTVKVPLDLISKLKQITKLGVQDCRNALLESNLDFEKAQELLKQKSIKTAQKKDSRPAAEGLISTIVVKNPSGGYKGALIELNCETDYCARADGFKELLGDITSAVSNYTGNPTDITSFLNSKLSRTNMSVEQSITEMIGQMRENIRLRRILTIEGPCIGVYVHNPISGNLRAGNAACLLALDTDKPEPLVKFASRLATHVAAMHSKYISQSDIPLDLKDNQEAKEAVLLDQDYILAEGITVSKAIEEEEKKIGSPIRVHQFIYLKKGEGVEVKRMSFKDEVAAKLKKL